MGAILLLQLLHDGTSLEDIRRLYQGFNSPMLASAFAGDRAVRVSPNPIAVCTEKLTAACSIGRWQSLQTCML